MTIPFKQEFSFRKYISIHLKIALLYLSTKQLQRIWHEFKDKDTALTLGQETRYPNQGMAYNDGRKYNIDRV
jgi:hypothetical protein